MQVHRMGSSSSSFNKSPFRSDNMVNPESPTKDDNSLPMTVKNDNVSITPNLLQSSPSVNKNFESPRKSTSIPVDSPANNNHTPVKSRWSFSSSKKSFGSKDETFFDTQQWLQSDSDDDFHSVNGDFTPSRGNTPMGSFSDRPPRYQSLIFQEKMPSRGSSSPAPLLRRKKLGELFRDSIREEREESSEGSSALSTPYLSGTNSGEFNNGDSSMKEEKKKSNWQHHRCLPGFSSCSGSFVERRKKMSSETAVVALK